MKFLSLLNPYSHPQGKKKTRVGAFLSFRKFSFEDFITLLDNNLKVSSPSLYVKILNQCCCIEQVDTKQFLKVWILAILANLDWIILTFCLKLCQIYIHDVLFVYVFVY